MRAGSGPCFRMQRLHLLAVSIAATAIMTVVFHERPRGEAERSGILRIPTTPRPVDSGPVPDHVTARRLAGGNRAEADRWLATLEPAARDEALSILAAEEGRSDPQRAEYDARRISDPLLRRESLSLALAYRFDQDPDAALAILRNETDPVLKAAIRARLLPSLAETDAPAAACLLAETEMDRTELARLVATTSQRWAVQDPVAAAEWISDIGDGALRQSSTAALVGEWGRCDVFTLEQWLYQHPTAAEFQSAYADWLDPWTPQQWEEWTNQLSNASRDKVSTPSAAQDDPSADSP